MSTRRSRVAGRAGRAGRAVGVLGELFLTLGALVLLFVAWQVWWVTGTASRASAEVVDTLSARFASAGRFASTGAPPAAGTTDLTDRPPTISPRPVPGGGTTVRSPDVAVGDPFGIVTVPRFGNGPQPILQGTNGAQLDRGVGHEPTSAMPGHVGNFATAGHRDTYSHPYQRIDELRPGDAIVVEVADGWAIYRAQSHRIVEPWQVEVYAPVPDRPGATPTQSWMTLVACEPHWTALRRWVVHALLQEWAPRTADTPAATDHPQLVEALDPPDP